MKSYVFLLISVASLAAAEPIIGRQEAAPTANRGDEYRHQFCIKTGLPECDQAVDQCRKDKKPVWNCVNQTHKSCVVDNPSACAQAVDRCLNDSNLLNGDTSDDAVKGCIVQELSLGSDEGNRTESEALAACGRASELFKQTWDANNCVQFVPQDETRTIEDDDDGSNVVSGEPDGQ